MIAITKTKGSTNNLRTNGSRGFLNTETFALNKCLDNIKVEKRSNQALSSYREKIKSI